VEGEESIPSCGAFVIVANHYERPGLNVHFAGALMSCAVGRRRPQAPEVHWITTSQWIGRRLGVLPVPDASWRWAFRRVARMYGFVIMPRATERVMGRAAALRQAMACALGRDGRPGEPLGLMPEAVGNGILIEAQPGVGLFLKALSDRGLPLLPVGLREHEGGALVASFGEPFRLSPVGSKDSAEVDRLARERVMVAIGRLLPREYWGFYEDAVSRAVEVGARSA
jgi:1-acyl-sn-glycerol-3-phosphate acyltransferase